MKIFIPRIADLMYRIGDKNRILGSKTPACDLIFDIIALLADGPYISTDYSVHSYNGHNLGRSMYH